MAVGLIRDIRKIYARLHTDQIRAEGARNITIGLSASSEEAYQAMEQLLRGTAQSSVNVIRVNGSRASEFDLVLSGPGQPLAPNGSFFDPGDPKATIRSIVSTNPDFELALARSLPQFRKAVAETLIHRVSTENAMFSLMTALPNVIPSFLELPWTVGEFATDTAFLTMNQLRMAMLLAAVYDRPVGFGAQKAEMAAIVGSAFGWRAIARELVGLIPLGGGLIPKAAIAFAGTWVLGLGLEKFNRIGSGLSKEEKRDAYIAALARGRETVRDLAPTIARPKGS